MAGIVWLASYPKSGNTWVRLFIATLRHRDAPWSLQLARCVPGSRRAAWRCGLSQTEACRPLVVKIHDSRTSALAPAEVTQAAVYLVRDPRDVALSLAAAAQISHVRAVAGMAMRIDTLGTWSSHIVSWLAAPFPVLLVRYEDLLMRPLESFGAIAALITPEASDADVVHAVERVRFDRLQAAEAEMGFAEAPRWGGPFFRSGTAGQWRTQLAPALARAIERTHRAAMERCGYLHAAGDRDAYESDVERRRRRA